MLLPRTTRVRASLCLFLCLDLAAAARFVGVRRDETSSTVTPSTSTKLPSLSTSADPSSITVDGDANSNSTTIKPSSSPTLTPSTSVSLTEGPTPTAVESSPSESGFFNNTITPGSLPLNPTLTPAYGVGGTILIITGIGYGFVGIKSRWVHSFMAAAYLASLGTTILIVYVLTPPISDAVQGAYLVAVVVTGLILGGAALVFKEITECLGSLLGGFCLAMWLLTLAPGGLVHGGGTGAKVGFILAFTLAAFATYFHPWTRHYGLMMCISFAGATATVLGIDCFSRAGLKEFWAYVWDLNDRLFPLGADTYPVTRGIKVEQAAIVLLFLAGMLSQLKIWRVIQKKRDQRERQRAEARRATESEDLGIGKQVERMTHRERRAWERVYGDGAEKGFTDSGVGSMGSSVKMGGGGPVVRTSRVVSPMSPVANDDQFQLVEIPLDGGVSGSQSKRRTVDFRATRASVRHSQIRPPTRQASTTGSEKTGADVPKIWVVGSDGAARLEKESEGGSSRTFSPGPKVVPLPFTVRTGDDDEVPDDRSSIAAVDDEDETRTLPPDSRRNSLAKRLSVGSGKLLRSLSQRSKQTIAPNEDAGESREELVISRQSRLRDDNSSLAATLDDLSSDGRVDDDSVIEGSTRRYSDAEGPVLQEKRKSEEKLTQAWLSPASPKLDDGHSTAETSSTKPQSAVEGDSSKTPEAVPSTKPVDDAATSSGKGSETASAVLKPEHLPRPLSRVALSYRTNEWAKHLSHAEAPEPENIVPPAPGPIVEEESAAPVDVDELQKTADNAARPVAAPRSASSMSNYSAIPPAISRANSNASLQQAESRNISPTGSSFPPQVHKNPKRAPNSRRTSAQHLAETIAEEGEGEGEGTVCRSPTIPEDETTSRPQSLSSSPSPIDPMQVSASTSTLNLANNRPPVPGVISYSSPQSLTAKRESLLRNRSQASIYGSPEANMLPTIYSHPSSETASSTYFNHHPTTTGLGIAAAPPSSRTSLEANPDMGDNLPMSARRQILRQSSLDLPTPGPMIHQQQQPYLSLSNAASTSNFDSHQPIHRRVSANALGTTLPTEAARQAQLASFRNSVQQDLHHKTAFAGGSAFTGPTTTTPWRPPSAAGPSTTNLLYGAAGAGWDATSVDQQRTFLMGEKLAEAQRREVERLERERNDAEFEERMRRGELLEAHRDAMRRLQGGVKDL
ncbi:hypothetical protein GE09DRAFT_112044 [Coniochaeta sp. 2T2.1]|nr:hypothetical protein GE09DRAFT_112044 [Coniochaeta sp. 2T2.1]